MDQLTLIDAAALLFIAFSVARGRNRPLSDALHGLIALLLLIALFMGLRMTGQMRELLGGVAEQMRAIPGLGSKLLVIVAAWYLMRLIRRRSGYWIEHAVPQRLHSRITPVSEGLRAALLAGFIAWLAEGWFDRPPQHTPLLVQGVRSGDAWVNRLLRADRPLETPAPTPRRQPWWVGP